MNVTRDGVSCTVYWDMEVFEVIPVDQLPKKEENAVRFALVSDTHEKTTKLVVPECDVLIHAGDFTFTGARTKIENFAGWLNQQEASEKIVIAGNHDITFDKEYYERSWKRFHKQQQDFDPREIIAPHCTYLEDQKTEKYGFSIYGSPYSPEFCDWAFGLPRGEPMKQKWAEIPDQVDVLITHGPPGAGLGGVTSSGFDAGCLDLWKRIRAVKPFFHVSGHIHEDRGVRLLDDGIFYINACSVNLRYQPGFQPIIVDMKRLDVK